jgi:hypothetical protein
VGRHPPARGATRDPPRAASRITRRATLDL